MYRLTNADWTVIESGARLVSGGNVYPFGQLFGGPDTPRGSWAAPSGFVAMTAVTFPKVPLESLRVFEAQLRRSQQTVSQVNAILASKPTPVSTTQTTALLRSRAAMVVKDGARDDELGCKLAETLLDTLAPPDLIALRDDVGWDVQFVLASDLQRRPAGVPVGTGWRREGECRAAAGFRTHPGGSRLGLRVGGGERER